METEFEVKILEIDVDAIQEKLKFLGAEKIGEKFQKRYIYDLKPYKKDSWIRLRTDGNKTTLCIKEIHNNKIDGTKELEVEVSDFEKTNLILEKLGFECRAYEENKRISYVLDDVEIEIDFWPLIPPYLEIEGKSIKDVEKMIEKLGFDVSQTTSINTNLVYRKYGYELHAIKILKF